MGNPFTSQDNPFAIIHEEILFNRNLIIDLQTSVNKLVSEKKEVFLSPEETRKMFTPAISKSTLIRWHKKSLVKRHIIGGRVCYKLSEIEQAAKSIQPYKTRGLVETKPLLQ